MRKLFKSLMKGERGDINIGGILMMGIGMVFLAVGFIMFPIATDACQDLVNYVYSGLSTITASTFTGFVALVGIVPLLILVCFLAGAVIMGLLGFKVMREAGTANFNPGNVMLMGLAIVFISISLIIMPVCLDGVSANLAQKGPYDQTNTGITTAVGVTTANYTLTKALFNSDTGEVISVTSNITETPAVVSYSGGKLYLSTMTANETRTLVTVYNYANIDDSGFTGLSPLLKVSPMLVLIGFLCAGVISGFFGIKNIAEF